MVFFGLFFQDLPFFKNYQKYTGARACIGRKYVKFILISFPIKNIYSLFFLFFHRFAETSSTAVLAMLVSQYKITIKEEPQFVGETFEERKTRILSSRRSVTITYVSKQEPLSGLIKIDLFFIT